MIELSKGRYVAREARGPREIGAAQVLRAQCFGLEGARDVDDHDARCTHVVIKSAAHDPPVACFRLTALQGQDLAQSYAARFYGLGALQRLGGPMLELDRFCVDPIHSDPDILRLAWAALTQVVDREHIRLIFGCASFRGVAPEGYLDAFALLRARHLAPQHWRPEITSRDIIRFDALPERDPDPRRAMGQMPPLLRSYLAMGGAVSDHAVVDRELGTLHVFTGLEVGAIPATRKRLLRAMVRV